MVERELKAGALMRLQVESFNYESLEPIYLIRLRQAPLSQLAKMSWEEVVGSFGES